MEFVREGFRAVERHWRIVALYTLSIAIVGLSQMAIVFLQRNELFGLGDETVSRFTEFASDLIVTALASAIQAIFFSELGKEIDKPLYKMSGPIEALRRFFTMWFLLNLVVWLLFEWIIWAQANDHPTAGLAFIVLWFWSAFYLPVGACIMFGGTTEAGEVANSMAPLGRFLPATLVVILLLSFSFFLGITFGPSLAPRDDMSLSWIPGWAALLAFMALVDCVAFASVWEICRAHREQGDDTDDFDF